MHRKSPLSKIISLLTAISILCGGCARDPGPVFDSSSFQHFQRVATDIEFPTEDCDPQAEPTAQPLTITDQPREFWDMKLEEAMQMTLQKSRVMRDLGGIVLRSPATVKTVHGPAIVETDPRFGVEAALSEFDTTFAARTSWEKNDRALNNLLLGGGTNFFRQDLGVVQYQFQKKTATGSTFTLRQNTDYDANSAPANLFGSAWNMNYEAEYRQPLLQNFGTEYNRIAGPNGQPGQYNGVLVARTQTDIAIADFEVGIRDLISNVENAYWDLYFAYRDLDAKVAARDSALESWRRVQALNQAGRKGGEAEKEAEAREQYFRFTEEAQNALTGRLIDGTQTNNGSSGGSFRSTSGVHVAERRLRLLLGLPITDGRLIRPLDEPTMAKIIIDWNTSLEEAYVRRAELRRQHWIIKRRELELCGARNFLLPTLDTVGRYRFRGFGKHLYNNDGFVPPQYSEFENAYDNMLGGDFQEWQLGLEFNMPIGLRKGHAAVRQAELLLARERAILVEQERDVQLGLSNAFAEVERAWTVAQTNYNRRVAAKEHLAAIKVAYDADKAALDLVLEAQRRAADTESRFHASLVDYALSIKNVHYEKGTLLDHNSIRLAEGPWPGQAHDDAARRDGSGRPWGPLNYVMTRGPAISEGGFTYEQVGTPANGEEQNKNATPQTPEGTPSSQQAPTANNAAQNYQPSQGTALPPAVPPKNPTAVIPAGVVAPAATTIPPSSPPANPNIDPRVFQTSNTLPPMNNPAPRQPILPPVEQTWQ